MITVLLLLLLAIDGGPDFHISAPQKNIFSPDSMTFFYTLLGSLNSGLDFQYFWILGQL